MKSASENAALQKARQTLYDEGFVPFRDVFQRLKHVDLVELAAIERPIVGGRAKVPCRPLSACWQAARSCSEMRRSFWSVR
ncbi:hypothetical protein ABZY09_35215 [Streptomyces sp. NPDC002928]|uniref:hypothetical protein n=1 Tax=Streptomyces sp. NPDC002928 TaxID=3154440 RepID=UPI0033BA2075